MIDPKFKAGEVITVWNLPGLLSWDKYICMHKARHVCEYNTWKYARKLTPEEKG